jgi:enterochelin esterase-like enzyme
VGGVEYKADRFSNGGMTTSTTDPIAGTTADAIYQSERYGNFKYEIPVKDAVYSVVLHFAEIYQTAASRRLFSVTVEGQPVFTDMDLFTTVGHDTAYEVVVSGIAVADKSLTIELTSSVDNATISGFAIYSNDGGEFTGGDVPDPVVREVIDPPSNFTQFAGGARGTVTRHTYNASAVGRTLATTVYLPPAYSASKKYPVLYLLHGIGGDEWEWQRHAGAGFNNIMDNLHNQGLITEMIVVMPDGNAKRGSGNDFDSFAAFEGVLLQNLIPFIESTYPAAATGRENRALAGLSMGGGQALTFGLKNTSQFAWVAGFSSAPNLNQRPTNYEEMRGLSVIFISCGDADSLFSGSNTLHNHLTTNNVPHLWKVYPGGGHDMNVWNRSLYSFARMIFK